MVAKRYFAVEEVEALIPELQAIFIRLLQLHPPLRAAGERLNRLGHPPSAELLGNDAQLFGSAEVRQLQARFRALYEQVGSDVRQIEALGGQVKDLELGLVDFPALLGGQSEVLLCWRVGERAISFFHDMECGFGGRQPVQGNEFTARQGLH